MFAIGSRSADTDGEMDDPRDTVWERVPRSIGLMESVRLNVRLIGIWLSVAELFQFRLCVVLRVFVLGTLRCLEAVYDSDSEIEFPFPRALRLGEKENDEDWLVAE